MGRKQKNRGRSVNGILIVDKPKGETSNSTLQSVKRIYFAAKAGHTGSLDPLATGVLPVCFGEATKFSQYLLDSDKEYVVTARLGQRTNTGDADGELIDEQPVPLFTREQIEEALKAYRGRINQIPSMYSALKHQGQPLYKLARQGIEVDRPARAIVIYENEFLEYRLPLLTLRVLCSKGTYIRTLVEDLGSTLGCGAHVVKLCRTKAGPFVLNQALSLPQLFQWFDGQEFAQLNEQLLPVSSAVSQWPSVCLTETSAYYFCKGQPVTAPELPNSGWVRITRQGQGEPFIGMGEVLEDGRVAPRRLIRS